MALTTAQLTSKLFKKSLGKTEHSFFVSKKTIFKSNRSFSNSNLKKNEGLELLCAVQLVFTSDISCPPNSGLK